MFIKHPVLDLQSKIIIMESKCKKTSIKLENGSVLSFIYFISDAKCNSEQKEMGLVDLYCRLKEGDVKHRIENPNNEIVLKKIAQEEMCQFIKVNKYVPL